MWSYLFGLLMGEEGEGRTVNTPPLHPLQRFFTVCDRIHNNDEEVDNISFQYEIVHFPTLAKAVAGGMHLKDLGLESLSVPMEQFGGLPATQGNHNRPPADDRTQFNVFCLDGLSMNQSLVKLNLSGNPLFQEGAQSLQLGIETHPALQVLHLSRCHLANAGIRALAVSKIGVGLKELDISKNRISDGSAIVAIVSKNRSLHVLNARRNILRQNGYAEIMARGLGSLHSLDVSGNRIELGVMRSAGIALEVGTCHLRELRISNNPIRSDGMIMILEMRALFRHLDVLELRCCDLPPQAAIMIAAKLEDCDSPLRALYLGANRISNEGACSVAGASTRIVRLDLARCNIVDGTDLLEVLKTNSTIQYIDISRNKIPKRRRDAINFWTRLNSLSCRQLLQVENIPASIWPQVLSGLNGDIPILYYLLVNKPDLVGNNFGGVPT